MSKWKEYLLADVAVINARSINKDFAYSQIEYIDTASVTQNRFEASQIIELKDAPSRAKRLVAKGDTIISTVRPNQKHYGFITDSKPNTVVSTGFAVVTPKEIDPKFLYYFLSQEKIVQHLNTLAESGSTTFPAIRPEVLEDLVVYAPESSEEQTAIAEILSSLDDKIELNNQINKNLEALAQALFKQWFVDFDFPDENGQPYKSSGGEMVESELGMIPKGWRLVKVSDLAPKLETGKRPKGGVKGIEQGIPSVGAESIKGLGYFDFSKTKFVSDEYAQTMNRGWIKGFELLIYKDGGKPGTFIPNFGMFGEGFPFSEFVINEHIFSLDFSEKEFNCFSYFFFDSHYVRPILANSGGKAAIPGINQGDINNLKMFDPQNQLVKLFGVVAKSVISNLLNNCKENRHLSELRDRILPKLITGELKV